MGSHLPADIFARFLRLFEKDVIFIGGTDEHGTPTEVAALKAGLSPREFSDKYYLIHKKIYEWIGISYNNFSRTSNPTNHNLTQEIFLKLFNRGFISKKKILLPYCNKDKRFLPDRYVEGTCPICGYKPARGDQCESCTKLLDPQELKEPYCIICKTKPVFKEVEHLFLELEKFSSQLDKWIKSNKHWKPNVRNFALSWIKEGLKPRCITRDLEWGVKVPLQGFQNKVFYVWLDAPIGYISGTKEYFERIGRKDEWKKYWKEKDSKIFHFIGKDNIPFHTITWPATLLGTEEYTLPFDVVGYEFLNYRGQKISKSRNWGVFLEVVDGEVKAKVEEKNVDVDPDLLRYYLASILPESKDSNFVWEEFETKVNGELIDNFGNFVHRVLTFIKSNFNSTIPEPNEFSAKDKALIKLIEKTRDDVEKLIWKREFREALKKILELTQEGNRYFQSKKPWASLKKNSEDARNTLFVACNLIRSLAIFYSPFIPFATDRLWKQLGHHDSVHEQNFKNLAELNLKPGTRVVNVSPLFKKFETK